MTSELTNVGMGAIPIAYTDEIFQWPIAKLKNFDVWDTILNDYITNPADKMNLILASPQFFGPLLKEQKCSILFGQVAHILHKNNYLDITNKELLEYRRLSKSCKLSLDKSLKSNTPCFVNLNGIDHDKNNPRHNCWTHQYRNKSNFDCQINCYRSLIENGVCTSDESSPFVNGSFYGYGGPYSSTETTNRNLFLSTFGSLVYNFRFDRAYYCHSCVRFCNLLRMMPNLRTVELTCYFGMPAKLCLPDLNHLEVLKLTNLNPSVAQALLLKYGPKLKKLALEMSNQCFMDELMYASALYSAKHLKELSLSKITDGMEVHEFLASHVKYPLSLTSISITLELKSTSSRNFKELTNALHKLFGNSGRLNTLNLFILPVKKEDYYNLSYWKNEMKNIKNIKFIGSYDSLKLPSLRRLWIHCERVPFNSLDFILGVENSLEELVLNLYSCVPEERSTINRIQFVDYWHKMDESNVWKLMSKLQNITIRCSNKEDRECEFPMHCYEYKRPTTAVLSTYNPRRMR